MRSQRTLSLVAGRMVVGEKCTLHRNLFQHRGANGVTPCWYYAGFDAGTTFTSTLQFTENRLTAVGFVVPFGGTVDQLGILIPNGQSSKTCRLGIYEATSDTNLYPNALILDAGTVSVASSGVLCTISVSQVLRGGRVYYYAFWSNATTATMSAASGSRKTLPFFGHSGAPSGTCGGRNAVYVSQAYSTFPSTFPASGTATVCEASLGYRLAA